MGKSLHLDPIIFSNLTDFSRPVSGDRAAIDIPSCQAASASRRLGRIQSSPGEECAPPQPDSNRMIPFNSKFEFGFPGSFK